MAKKLKTWNGRGHGKIYSHRGHFYVAAYSQKQARELIEKASGTFITTNEIRDYYSEGWGNTMEGIVPTEPCVYATENFSSKPIKII